MANNTEKRITAKMVLDSTGYNDKLKGLNSEMKKHQSELKLASEGIKAFGKDSEKLKSVQESLTKQVELHSKKVELYKQSIEKATSKMQENINERDRLKDSLDKANKKYEEAVKIYGKESEEAKKAKENVDKLKSEHDKSSKAVETNAKQTQNYETNLNKAKEQMVKTQGELKKVSAELDKSKSKWLNASEGLKKSSEKLKDVGGKVSSAGGSILKLTAPLAAGGIASLKFATDFEDAVAKVSTISDESEVSIGDLRKGILKLSNDTGIASTEIANNVYDAISAGQKTGDAVNFVSNSTKLAKAGFAEAGQSLDVLTTILNAYKMKSEDVTNVSDILIQVQNKGKVTVGELSSVMGKIIPTAVATNTNLKQLGAGYALMTSQGVKAAETTTYMNSMLNELSKSGTGADLALRKVSGKSFTELMASGKNLSEVLVMLDEHAKKNNLSLKDMFGSAEAGKAALILSQNAGEDFNSMLKDMESSTGATDEAFKKVSNTTGERFKKSLNQIKNEAIRLGDSIAPLMDKLSGGIGIIANKLNGLSKEQLDSYVKWGMIAIASGGMLKVLGGGISTIGNIAGGLSKLTGVLGKAKIATEAIGASSAVAGGGLTALSSIALPATAAVAGLAGIIYAYNKNAEYMGEASNKSTQDMGAMETAMAGLKGHIVHTNKELADMNVKYKEWSNDVSPETQKSLDDISNKISNYNLELAHASKLDTLADEETGARLNTRLDEICNSAIDKIKSRSPEVHKTMKESFEADGVIDEEEQKILDSLSKSGDDQIQKIQETKAKILELEQRASTENGEVRQETLKEVERLTQEIGNVEMQNTVNSKQELLAAQADFNARMKNLDMQGMSNLLQEKAKVRDEETQKINQKYNTEIEMLKLNLANVDEETKKAYENKITQLETQRDKEVGIENEKYTGFLDTTIDKNGQIINYIDMHNGTMLNKQQQQKTFELNEFASKMDSMLDITSSGYYKIKDKTTGEMHECYVEVDSTTGKIVGAWDSGTEEIYGNPVKAREEIDKDLKNGSSFEPVANSWDSKKHEIWENAVEVQSKSNYGLFDWVTDAYAGMQSWLNKHPFISSVAKGAGFNIGQNWTGTNYWDGGLTYLHDAPGKNSNYELYDLPKGTRIFNRDASADMVIKTAESVAEKVAQSVLQNIDISGSGSGDIIIPINIAGEEIDRVVVPRVSNKLALGSIRGR